MFVSPVMKQMCIYRLKTDNEIIMAALADITKSKPKSSKVLPLTPNPYESMRLKFRCSFTKSG
jgi:hypothetical protein